MEETPLGNLAAPCHLEENASHHFSHRQYHMFAPVSSNLDSEVKGTKKDMSPIKAMYRTCDGLNHNLRRHYYSMLIAFVFSFQALAYIYLFAIYVTHKFQNTRCAGVQMYKCTHVQMLACTHAQMYMCTNVQTWSRL